MVASRADLQEAIHGAAGNFRDPLIDLLEYDSGAGAPSSTPDRIGKWYLDTTGDDFYISIGTDSSADWIAFGSGLTVAEMAFLDGVVAGTRTADKAIVVDSAGTIDAIDVDALSLNGVLVTADSGEINILNGATLTVAELNGLDNSAAYVEGISPVLVASATYDFAVEGGAQAAIGLGVTIPADCLILDGMVDVQTTLISSGDNATIALHVEAANDVVVAVAIGTGTPWDQGLRAIVPAGVIANAIKTTAAREITATIAVENVTAGKFVVHLRYVKTLVDV